MALVAVALTAGACGGGSAAGEGSAGPTTTAAAATPAAGSSTPGSGRSGLDAFRQCMADKGVTLPDPGAGPPGSFPAPTKEMASAFQACRGSMPRGGMPADAPGMQQFTAYMNCIMENGVAMDHSGNAPMTAPNFDDPTFRKADQACAALRPGRPTTTTG